jgi:hypothetical protein
LYLTNASMVIMSFAMVDPAMGAGRRVNYLRAVVDAGLEAAREYLSHEGFVWCCTDNAVVGRIYAEAGMVCPGEADVYFYPVGNQCSEFLK